MEISLEKLKEALIADKENDRCTKEGMCSNCQFVDKMLADTEFSAMFLILFQQSLLRPSLIPKACVQFLFIGMALAEASSLESLYEKIDPA